MQGVSVGGCVMATEKRLIDANALIAEFEWLQSQVSSTTALEIQEHIQRIKDAPTVDAVEVMHGHWVITGGNQYTIFRRCSICCAMYDFTPNYCPNCGAKMDGDGNA